MQAASKKAGVKRQTAKTKSWADCGCYHGLEKWWAGDPRLPPEAWSSSFEPVARSAQARVRSLLREGKAFRHGRTDPDATVVQCENQLADYMGLKHCVATESFATAVFLALKAAGVGAGSQVLTNAFAGTPSSAAVQFAGASHVPVENTRDMVIDLHDLICKADQTGAKFLLLSHTCGFIPDLDKVTRECALRQIQVIEDCADSIGSQWDGRHIGHHSLACCISVHGPAVIGAGNIAGGFVVTDHAGLAAAVAQMAGCYEGRYQKESGGSSPHKKYSAAGSLPDLFLQMSNLTAAVVQPQLSQLEARVAVANKKYERVRERFVRRLGADAAIAVGLHVPKLPLRARLALNNFQFSTENLGHEACDHVVVAAGKRGVPLQVFSTWSSQYAGAAHGTSKAFSIGLPPRFRGKQLDRLVDALVRVLNEAIAQASHERPGYFDPHSPFKQPDAYMGIHADVLDDRLRQLAGQGGGGACAWPQARSQGTNSHAGSVRGGTNGFTSPGHMGDNDSVAEGPSVMLSPVNGLDVSALSAVPNSSPGSPDQPLSETPGTIRKRYAKVLNAEEVAQRLAAPLSPSPAQLQPVSSAASATGGSARLSVPGAALAAQLGTMPMASSEQWRGQAVPVHTAPGGLLRIQSQQLMAQPPGGPSPVPSSASAMGHFPAPVSSAPPSMQQLVPGQFPGVVMNPMLQRMIGSGQMAPQMASVQMLPGSRAGSMQGSIRVAPPQYVTPERPPVERHENGGLTDPRFAADRQEQFATAIGGKAGSSGTATPREYSSGPEAPGLSPGVTPFAIGQQVFERQDVQGEGEEFFQSQRAPPSRMDSPQQPDSRAGVARRSSGRPGPRRTSPESSAMIGSRRRQQVVIHETSGAAEDGGEDLPSWGGRPAASTFAGLFG